MKKPSRIICLTAETAELLFDLGVGKRVVGVSSFAKYPLGARLLPNVGAYTTIEYDRVDALEPDLVLAFSDLQADAAAELSRRGHNVLLTNQRTLEDIFDTTMLIGRVVGEEPAAASLVEGWKREIAAGESASEPRPRVYFEEWNDPLICGIGWVSELIVAAGGIDVFAELAKRPAASERVITPDQVLAEKPEVILGSWCGKPFRPDEVIDREGWSEIPAVANRRVFSVAPEDCLQPGVGLFKRGLGLFRNLLKA